MSQYLTSNWLDRSRRKAKIVDHMFRVGADASFKTMKGGCTLGHLAASADEVGIELLMVLADHGVHLHAEDDQGRTVLHQCALNGSIAEENGLSTDSRDKSGMTLLALATEKKTAVHDPELWRSDRWAKMERLLQSHVISQ